MSLLEDWRKYAEDGQQAQGVKFWKQYFDQETQFYRQLLTGGDQPGTLSQCAQRFGESAALNPANLIDSKRFEVKTGEVTVSVDPACSYLVETRIIDGKKYILVPAGEDVEVNGQPVRFVSDP